MPNEPTKPRGPPMLRLVPPPPLVQVVPPGTPASTETPPNNVVLLADHNDSSLSADVDLTLQTILQERQAGKGMKGGKGLFITLDTHPDGRYNFHWRQAGFRLSEMIALLSAMQHEMNDMLAGND